MFINMYAHNCALLLTIGIDAWVNHMAILYKIFMLITRNYPMSGGLPL